VRGLGLKFSLHLAPFISCALVYGYLDVMVDGSDALALEGLSLAIVVDYPGIFP
jgi:hypothetical protein